MINIERVDYLEENYIVRYNSGCLLELSWYDYKIKILMWKIIKMLDYRMF